MSSWPRRLWRALTRNIAVTDRLADDPRLRGRTYAIPFEQVWQATLALPRHGLKRWTVVHADDDEGTVRMRVRPALLGTRADVTIRIGLDANAQTRVDARSRSRAGLIDFGGNARRIGRFFRGLDRALARRRAARAPASPRSGA